tara:strand:- start:3577 stop:4185 length:609 start_codon:yes stop_codon:yes gene_type:complete
MTFSNFENMPIAVTQEPAPQILDTSMMNVSVPQELNQPIPESEEDKQLKKEEEDKKKMDSFIKTLIGMSGYTHELQTQAHLIHFNYEAQNFLAVHEFLKEQYEAHQEQFDKLGEFVRSMDFLLPMCRKGLLEGSAKFEHVKSYEPKSMLMAYFKNLETLASQCKKAQVAARKNKVIDVENYLGELCGDLFKAAWMIKATLRN